jgi:hypothetical protein
VVTDTAEKPVTINPGDQEMSQERQCYIWKATDGKWYLELGNFEHAYESKDCTRYGPFRSESAATTALEEFSNPGSIHVDASGKVPPPSDAQRID